jgi:hypothetical protein
MSNRIALATNVAPKLEALVRRAARQSDQKTAEYVRSAIVAKLRNDGHDVGAALLGQD